MCLIITVIIIIITIMIPRVKIIIIINIRHRVWRYRGAGSRRGRLVDTKEVGLLNVA